MSNPVKFAITLIIAAACVLAIAHGLRDPRVDDVWVNETRKPATSMWYEARIAELEAELRQCRSEGAVYLEAIGHLSEATGRLIENPMRGRDRPWPEAVK